MYEDIREWLLRRNQKPWSDKTIVSRVEHHEAARELGMEKEKIRNRPGRSCRAADFGESRPTPGQFHAWTGVRFAGGQAEQAEPADQAKSRTVTGGTAHAGGPKRKPSRRVVSSTRPTRPTDGS